MSRAVKRLVVASVVVFIVLFVLGYVFAPFMYVYKLFGRFYTALYLGVAGSLAVLFFGYLFVKACECSSWSSYEETEDEAK